jgi:hypothetical protein
MQRLAIGGGATIGIVTYSDRERGVSLNEATEDRQWGNG